MRFHNSVKLVVPRIFLGRVLVMNVPLPTRLSQAPFFNQKGNGPTKRHPTQFEISQLDRVRWEDAPRFSIF